MSIRHVMVTGAGGFIGFHLSNHLARQGLKVTGVDVHYPRRAGHPCAAEFEVVRGDFRNEGLMEKRLDGVDVLLHLASAHLQVSLDESEYWDINARSLPALLEAALRHGVGRFVHVSSVGIYGPLDACPADEQTACRPQSIYGRSKLEGEKTVLALADRTGFPVIVLRPAWVYGPGCTQTAKLYRALRKRRFAMFGRGANLRHPLFIEDFLKACDLAMAPDAPSGEVFIIGADQAITSRELIGSFCRILDLPRPRIRLPYWVGKMTAATAEGICSLMHAEPPISRRTLEFFDTDHAFDITKAKRLLGYEPAYSFEQGLSETRSWLQQVSNQ